MQERAMALPVDQYAILRSVPKRGSVEWEQREVLRMRLGCKCLSWGMGDAVAEQ
jgi:hypothetical protein